MLKTSKTTRTAHEFGKIIRSEYLVRYCVWVLKVVDLCVEPYEKHRLRPQSTEGMCHFWREGEAVQAVPGDLDILNTLGVSNSGPAHDREPM